MSWFETLRSGIEAITSHRLRSSLTVLGIMIGIAAVILTVGLGEGAASSVNSAINALGDQLVDRHPGQHDDRAGAGRFRLGFHLDLPGRRRPWSARSTAPTSLPSLPRCRARRAWWPATTIGRQRSMARPNPGCRYGAARWPRVRSSRQQEMTTDANVAVLGQTTAEELGLFSPVGQTINIGSIPFTVIGVLNSAGSSSSTNEDDMAVIPITTAQSEFLGSSSVSTIYLEGRSQSTLGAADQEATDELLALHGITSPASADFTITTQNQDRANGNLGRPDPDRAPGRDSGDLPPGRWHRGHEHHAGFGHGAGPGDRSAKGARGNTFGHQATVPRRGVDARPDRRYCGRRPRRGRGLSRTSFHNEQDRHICAGDGRCHCLCHSHRRGIRCLPGFPGGPPGADRSPSQRVKTPLEIEIGGINPVNNLEVPTGQGSSPGSCCRHPGCHLARGRGWWRRRRHSGRQHPVEQCGLGQDLGRARGGGAGGRRDLLAPAAARVGAAARRRRSGRPLSG